MKVNFLSGLLIIGILITSFTANAQLMLHQIDPIQGRVGTEVAIYGNGITNPRVYFGTIEAVVRGWTSTKVVVYVPMGASYDRIRVLNADGFFGETNQYFSVSNPYECGIRASAMQIEKLPTGGNRRITNAVVADINQDGRADWIGLDSLGRTPFLFINNSINGNFNISTVIQGSTFNSNMAGMAATDFDKDGRFDIIIGSENSIRLYKYDGFSFVGNPLTSYANNGILDLAVTDYNKDGFMDVVVLTSASGSSNVRYFKNNGGTSLSFEGSVSLGSAQCYKMQIADLDNDGFSDIAVTNSNKQLRFIRGTFSGFDSNFINIELDGVPAGLAVGDVDMDGILDIVTSRKLDGQISVFRGVGGGGSFNFEPQRSFPAIANAHSVCLSDIDGDDFPEICVTGGLSEIAIIRNISFPGFLDFKEPEIIPSNVGGTLRNICTGDLNHDGKPDLLVPSFNNDQLSAIIGRVPKAGFLSTTANICRGENVNLPVDLNGMGVLKLFYSEGNGPVEMKEFTTMAAALSVNPANSVYYVLRNISDENCLAGYLWEDSSYVDVKVVPSPTLISGQTSLCSGANTSLLFGPSGNYRFGWNVPVFSSGEVTGPGARAFSTDNTLTGNFHNTGMAAGTVTYSVIAQENIAGGCYSEPTAIVVNVVPAPMVNPSGSGNICSGQAANINLSSNIAGATFQWDVPSVQNVSGASAGSGNTIQNVLSTITPGSGTALYPVRATVNGCTGPIQNVEVRVYPIPDVITSGPSTICSGSTTAISLSSSVSPVSFSWGAPQVTGNVTGAGPGSANTIAQQLSYSGSTEGTVSYSIIASSAQGCMSSGNVVMVTVKPAVSAAISVSENTICEGGTTNLNFAFTGTGPWNVKYNEGNVEFIENNITQNPFSKSVSPASTSLYVVTSVATPNCTSNSFSNFVQVTVNPSPQVSFSGNTSICSGQTSNISLSSSVAGSTFGWLAPEITPNVSGGQAGSGNTLAQTFVNTSNAAGSASYSVRASAGGCTGPATSVQLTVKPNPGLTITGDSVICSGTALNLNLSSNFAGTTFGWSVSGATSNVSGASGGSGNNINQVLTNLSQLDGGVNYNVFATFNGCVSSRQKPVKVLPKSGVSFVRDESICSGESVNLRIGLSGAEPFSITYMEGQTVKTLSNITNSPYLFSVNPTVTTEYTLFEVTDGNGCQGNIQNQIATVTVLPLPNIVANGVTFNNTPATTVCSGTRVKLYGSGGSNYVWSGGVVNDQFFKPASSNTYTVQGTGANGCKNTASIQINVVPSPVVDAGPNLVIDPGQEVTLTATGSGGPYIWSDGVTDGVPFTPETAGFYYVSSTAGGCTARDSMLLVIRSANPNDIKVFFDGQIRTSETLIPLGNKTVLQGPYTYSVTIHNNGSSDLKIFGISFSGESSEQFSLFGFNNNQIISPNSEITFNVNFTPLDTGAKEATMRIFNNDPNSGLFKLNLTAYSPRIKPVITFEHIPNQEYGATLTINPSVNVNRPLIITSSDSARAVPVGNDVLLKSLGDVTLTALVEEDAWYESASVSRAFSINLPVMGILGPDFLSRSVVNSFGVFPGKYNFKYKWSYDKKNINFTTDTTSRFVKVFADETTSDGNLICSVYNSNDEFLQNLEKPVYVNKARIVTKLPEMECDTTVLIPNSYIKRVEFEKIKNTSTYNESGISDFTQSEIFTELFLGESYSGKVFVSGPDVMRGLGIWIDFNNDGLFGPDEYVFNEYKSDTVIALFNIRIPNVEYALGARRMRIKLIEGAPFSYSQSCIEDSKKGETEDYSVEIKARLALQGSEVLTPNGDGKNDCFIIRGMNPKASTRSLEVFDILGKSIYSSNDYNNDWCGTDNDGKLLPRGTYYYAFKTDGALVRSFFEIVY
ncbi:MAG: PKD-like domain-containing protein [Cytophagaceae bacterium]